ncbi:MAG: response regulator [Betaproteobacteria bacterium]|nr:response regulator [Betaproteobacteria bacterium]
MKDNVNRYRLLLVDDNPDDIQLATLALQRVNRPLQMEVLTDGQAAVEAILHQNPDLVIMDLNLPLLNGLEILKKVRPMYPPGTLPMIVLTTSNAEKDLLRAQALGCDEFHVKPLSFHEFVRLLEGILDRWLVRKTTPENVCKNP